MILREFIKSVIVEGALGIDDLAEDQYVLIARRGQGVKVELRTSDSAKPLGAILMKGPSDDCAGTYVIASSVAQHSWGPFLYDVAMEWATMYGDGLVPDRLSVSSSARNVWNYYDKSRSDVKSHQLDDPNNTLTPTDSDNCNQTSAEKDAASSASKADLADDTSFTLSSLSKRYTKEPTTINALKGMRKLRVEDF